MAASLPDYWCNTLPAFIGFGAGFVTAYIAHRFSVSRERETREHAEKTAKEARRRNFLSFLDGFRAEAERSKPRHLAGSFSYKIYKFREESAKIRGDIDFEKQSKFAELIDALCKLKDSEVEYVGDGGDYVGRRRVTEAIDAIKDFIAPSSTRP